MENFHKNNFYSVQTVYLLILFLNIILTEIILYSNGIHSYQIRKKKRAPFEMWWNGRFTSWMCSW